MFAHVFFVIYVFCYEVELVRSADKLDFWERDPKYDGRRANDVSKIRNVPNLISKTQFRYGKSKTIEKFRMSTEGNVTVKTEKLKPIQRSRLRTNNSQGDNEETKKWPNLRQRRYKQKGNREEFRSTRMTPLYLLQQEDETTTPHKLLETESDPDLSPYSIKQTLTALAREFHEANITVEVIGRTVEYNDIVMLKVTERKSEISKYFRADDSKYVDEVPEKKIIFIVHGLSVMGIHEIPCLVSISQIKKLFSFYFAYLDKFDIFLIPMANPDGFVSKNELWNKNRSPQGACPGVSLDRNFDVAWNSSQPINSCSQHFPGLTPFSEPETRAIREVLHHYSHKINGFFHVHSGSYDVSSFKGDAVLYPKGYTDVQSDDDKYIDLRGEIDEAMKNASFQVISVAVDTIHNWYGKVSGSSVDYASAVYGIPYAMELVMQPYLISEDAESNENLRYYALNEIWRRVIDVIFNSIWRNTKSDN